MNLEISKIFFNVAFDATVGFLNGLTTADHPIASTVSATLFAGLSIYSFMKGEYFPSACGAFTAAVCLVQAGRSAVKSFKSGKETVLLIKAEAPADTSPKNTP